MSIMMSYDDGVNEAMAMYSRELEVHEPHFFDDDCPVDALGMLGAWMADAEWHIRQNIKAAYHSGILNECRLIYDSIRGDA